MYRLHHVQVGIPPGSEAAARSFYVGLLGLQEVAKPSTLVGRGGLWLALDGGELHLGVEAPHQPPVKAHPAFELADWQALKDRLKAANVPVQDDDLLPGRRRFYVRDPFGNRLEFVERGST